MAVSVHYFIFFKCTPGTMLGTSHAFLLYNPHNQAMIWMFLLSTYKSKAIKVSRIKCLVESRIDIEFQSQEFDL